MKKSWKKALLAGLSIVMMGSFIAGCGSNNNGAANKDVLKVGVTNFASTLEPTENFFAWVVMRHGVGETLAKFDEKMKPQPWIASKWEVSPDHKTWTFKKLMLQLLKHLSNVLLKNPIVQKHSLNMIPLKQMVNNW